MSTSVRLRLVGWLQRIADDAAQKLMQRLRRDEIHSQAADHVRHGRVVGIDNASREPEAHCTVCGSRFGKQVDVVDRRFVVAPDVQPFVSQSQTAARWCDPGFIIRHQQRSFLPNVDLSGQTVAGFDMLAAMDPNCQRGGAE